MTQGPIARQIRRPNTIGREVVQVTVLALVLSSAGAWADGREAGKSACSGTVDPDCYLTISLQGRNQKALVAPYAGPSDIWEVVPTRGSLEVSFDLDEMKERWRFDTASSLSMWARKIPRPNLNDDTQAASVEIGIPPYSSLVEGLQIRGLDLAAANDLMNQMFQGSRNAHRIMDNESWAKIARLHAELDGNLALHATYLEYVVAVERALKQLYTESLRFTLDVADVEQAAGILTEANEALAEAKEKISEPALEAVANAAFFAKVAAQRPAYDSWLKGIQSDDVKPYLPVIARLIERPANVIEGVIASVKALFASVDAEDADEHARSTARRRLVELAEQLIVIETDLHIIYREAEDFGGRYEERPQYEERRLQDFVQAEIEAPREFGHRLAVELGKGKDTVPCGPKSKRDIGNATRVPSKQRTYTPFEEPESAEDKAQKRFDALEPLLRWIRGGKLPDDISKIIKARFVSQIEPLEGPLEEIEKRIEELREKLAEKQHWAKQLERALEQCEPQRERISNTIATLLMIDIMDRLIAQIVPGTLSLENADLDPGDRLEILISFSKPTEEGKLPPAQSYSFIASPFGWRAPFPYVTDMTAYAKPVGSNDYEFRPGLLAVWNYYGKAKKLKSARRTLAPGFGIHATSLQFSEDEDADDEFGIGVGVTLFDNLLTFAYGWNLQAEKDDSREYFSVGISVRRAMEKFAKQE